MHAGAALMGPSATLAALEGSSLRIGLVPISLYSGGHRSLEKLRHARIARRSISAADASQPLCSRNSRNARVLLLRQLSGTEKLARRILCSSNMNIPVFVAWSRAT